MERRIERIEALLERYFEAQTTPAEERELREELACAEPLPARLEAARRMFVGMEVLSAAKSPAVQSCCPTVQPARPGSAPNPRTAAAHRRRVLRIWAAGVAAATIGVGLFALAGYLNRPYCYIDGRPVRDAEQAMRTTVYFEPMKALDAPMEQCDGILNQLKNDKR